MDASDADIADAVDRAAEGLEGHGGLFRNGYVRGSGADNCDGAGERREGAADDGDAARGSVEFGVGELREEGLVMLGGGAGAEDYTIGIEEGAGNAEDLHGELAGAEDYLREAPTAAAICIDAGKT